MNIGREEKALDLEPHFLKKELAVTFVGKIELLLLWACKIKRFQFWGYENRTFTILSVGRSNVYYFERGVSNDWKNRTFRLLIFSVQCVVIKSFKSEWELKITEMYCYAKLWWWWINLDQHQTSTHHCGACAHRFYGFSLQSKQMRKTLSFVAMAVLGILFRGKITVIHVEHSLIWVSKKSLWRYSKVRRTNYFLFLSGHVYFYL